jgi:hypothetical protein
MAGPVDVPIMSPYTPPRTPLKHSNGFSSLEDSPSMLLGKSPADSGVGDVFDDFAPAPPKSTLPAVTVEPATPKSPPTHNEKQQNIMPEDPFDNQHNRILFNAIDALQSFGAGDLSIPQVCTHLQSRRMKS